jgi:hypothetical protein
MTASAVTRYLYAELVEEPGRDGAVEGGGESVCRHQAVTAVLLRVGRAAVLKVGPGELLPVVSETGPVGRTDLPVDLSKIDILIEAARIVDGQRQ